MTDLNKFQTEEITPFGLKITPQYSDQHIDTLSVEELKQLIKKTSFAYITWLQI